MSDRIDSLAELRQLAHLLELERDEERRIWLEEIQALPLEERQKRGLSWYPVQIEKEDFGAGETLLVTLKSTQGISPPSGFDRGQIAALFVNQPQKKQNPSIHGIVSDLRGDLLTMAFSGDELPDWVEDGRLGIDLYYDDTTWREMARALDLVQQAPRTDRLGELREILLGYQPPHTEALGYELNLPNLNDSQNSAVRKVLSARDAAVIHGPPGTGKTTTLVEAIRLTLKHEKQVLVTAPSNMAVDLLTERLTQLGVEVLRIGHPVRVSEAVRNRTLDHQLEGHRDFVQLKKIRKDAEEQRKYALKFKRNYVRGERREQMAEVRALFREARDLEKYILKDVLDSAQVIAATPVGATGELVRSRRYETVFIDEAAQMLEPAAWIVLSKAHRVVFAGDHCQLPPTVKSTEAVRKGLGLTLFEKFYQRQGQEVGEMLAVQYRMHREIMGFSNQEFYEHGLEAHASVAGHRLAPEEPPLEWIDTAGCGFEEILEPESRSLYNPEEAAILLKHLDLLFEAHPDETGWKIGIIAPYKEQVRYLRKQLPHQPFWSARKQQLVVDTVDGFQGQECDAIYISFVRSNEGGEVGFLKDLRRTNVAMTRARRKLVMVGDSATVASLPFYERLIDYINQHDAYRSAWEYMM